MPLAVPPTGVQESNSAEATIGPVTRYTASAAAMASNSRKISGWLPLRNLATFTSSSRFGM